MTSSGHVRTAAARAARTRAKHDRWARELSAAGWTMIRSAGHITVAPTNDEALRAWCGNCDEQIGEWDGFNTPEVPLPAVLAAVNGHTCTEAAA